MTANAMFCQSPSPKRLKVDEPQQNQPKQNEVDDEDLSFLDDIDIDIIVECLINSVDSSKLKHSNSEYSTTIAKEQELDVPKKHPLVQNDNMLCQLQKKLFQEYREEYITSMLYKGKHSKIFKCKNYASKNITVKMLNKESHTFIGQAKENMLLQVQREISKENLFCIYFRPGFLFDNRWCFVMEYYPKTLKEVIQELDTPFHINKVKVLAKQLISAVKMLNYNDIVHSDIKPSHILLDGSYENLRLCGFDAAYYNGSRKICTNVGIFNYTAPEAILGYSYGFSIDVWSTAVVLIEMATGEVLFPGHSQETVLYRQMHTLGTMPKEMIDKSKYKAQFSKDIFQRKSGFMTKGLSTKEKNNFSNNLSRVVKRKQTYHLLKSGNKEVKRFKQNTKSFIELLTQMLIILPEDRINILMVHLDGFFHENYE